MWATVRLIGPPGRQAGMLVPSKILEIRKANMMLVETILYNSLGFHKMS
jgi:hypothetical protein